MNIRLEGTRAEIREMEKIIQTGMIPQNFQMKNLSKFYPNKDELNGEKTRGRVYLEIEK